MGILKKIMYGSIALIFILMGGFGTQSNNTILQFGGLVGLLLGAVVLYIFCKMAWRAMGCIPSLLALIIIILFVLYAIGGFNGGIGKIGNNIQSFLGQHTDESEEVMANLSISQENNDNVPNIEDNNENVINLIGEDKHPIITENFLSKKEDKKENNSFNPMNYPAISGISRIVKGDTLTLSGRIVRLFGVASPDISQTCADNQGRGYRCGQQSISWLSGWLAENVIKCHILGEDKQGVLTGVCMLGPYDIGAAIVNAGWAVADTKQTQIYLNYQNQASQSKRGLWQGKFYMPWDWQKIKARKANIKIIKPKEAKRKSVWSNLF